MIRNFLSCESETDQNSHGGVGEIEIQKVFRRADFAGGWDFALRVVMPPNSSMGVHQHGQDEEMYIILKGEGRAFCAGADLNDENANLGADEAIIRAETEMLQEVTRQLLYSDKIVIGAIQGWAVGAGMEWAINCDFPIWAQSAKGFFPEAKWGLSVTGAITTLLPALVGPIKARELILLGEKQTADDFLRLGIAWKVVPDEQLIDEAMALANRLSSLHARSIADLKRGINLGSYTDIEKALAYETEIYVSSIQDPQTAENIKQFSED